MTTGGVESMQSNVEVIAATLDQRSVIANLFELYAHDFSEFHGVEIGEEGRFGYPELALYWSDAGRLPFLVRVKGKLAGFVLVKRGSELSGDPAIWDIAEFFILRRYRGRGIGSEVAHQVWRRVPGRWEIRVMESNQAGSGSGRSPDSQARLFLPDLMKRAASPGAHFLLSRDRS